MPGLLTSHAIGRHKQKAAMIFRGISRHLELMDAGCCSLVIHFELDELVQRDTRCFLCTIKEAVSSLFLLISIKQNEKVKLFMKDKQPSRHKTSHIFCNLLGKHTGNKTSLPCEQHCKGFNPMFIHKRVDYEETCVNAKDTWERL